MSRSPTITASSTAPIKDKQFNRLTIIRKSDYTNDHGDVHYDCKCKCGKFTTVREIDLFNNNIKSCGCLIYEAKKIHGLSDTRIYNIYLDMKRRCYDLKRPAYENYGGIGIYVCDEWLGDSGFINFYTWSINNGYNDTLTIDRIDNNGPYAPWNCRWVSIKIQANNKRSNRIVTHNNIDYTISQLSDAINIEYNALYHQISNSSKVSDILEHYNKKIKVISFKERTDI